MSKHSPISVDPKSALASLFQSQGLLGALTPLLNAGALKCVTEHIEILEEFGDVHLAVALRLLLDNHAKRAAVLGKGWGK